MYPIYSHSFLCFGTAQILTMYNTKLIKNSDYTLDNEQLKASCYPDGYTVELNGQDILNTPCVNGILFDQTHEFTVDTNKIDSNHVYVINGNSKKNKCREEINKLIPIKPCPYGSNQCSFNGVYLPPILESQFYVNMVYI